MAGMQMILVIGALMLLSVLTLNSNRAQLMGSQEMSEAEYIMTATAVGQTLINEIATEAFDQATVTNDTAAVATFTAPGQLGPGSGEAYPNFNDVDDYHRFTTTTATPRAGNFRAACLVDYVDPASPNSASGVRTRTKRVRVAVTSEFMTTTVNLVYYKSH